MATNRDDVAQESSSGEPENQQSEQHHLTSSPYDIPREDRTVSAHTYISDVDQQRLIKELRSEVALLREDLNLLSKRIEKLESR
jgi:hypothetical protein